MGVDVWLQKQKDDSFARTFTGLDAELTEVLVRDAKLLPALRRVAKQLHRQMPTVNGKAVLGVCFEGLTFNFILQPEARPAEGPGRATGATQDGGG